jgi:NH3-dependent NAD+ synthetase
VAQLAEEQGTTKRKFEVTLDAHRTSAHSKTDVLELIAKLQCDGSDEIVATRAAIASRLRQLVKEVLMFPAGNMCSAEQLREILGRDDVDDFLQDKPSKGERVVMVDFNDGTFTMVKPDEFNAGLADYVVTDKEWMQS